MKAQQQAIISPSHSIRSGFLSSWFLYLTVISTACFFIFQAGNAYANKTKHYYTFLAKAKPNGIVEAAPSLKWKNLLQLPEGDYYLHIVHISKNNNDEGFYVESYIFGLIVINDKTKNGIKNGIKIKKVFPINSIGNITINKNWAEEEFNFFKIGIKEKWDSLPSLLRQLVVDNKKEDFFTRQIQDENYHIHRLHKLTAETLDEKNLKNLWRLWQPKMDNYEDKKSIVENLNELEESVKNKENDQTGFYYANPTGKKSDKEKAFQAFFSSFVSQLNNRYKAIEKKREEINKEFKKINEDISATTKQYKLAVEKKDSALKKDHKNNTLPNIKKEINNAEKLLNKIKIQQKKLENHYKNKNKNKNKNYIDFKKEANSINEKIRILQEKIKNVINSADSILGTPIKAGVGTMEIFLSIIILMSIIMSIYIAMPSFFQKLFKGSQKKYDDEVGWDSNDKAIKRHISEKENRGNSPKNLNKKIIADPQLKKAIEGLQKKIGMLDSKINQLRNTVKIKDKELQRIAQNQRFIDTLFDSNDAKHYIKNIVRQYMSENNKTYQSSIQEREDSYSRKLTTPQQSLYKTENTNAYHRKNTRNTTPYRKDTQKREDYSPRLVGKTKDDSNINDHMIETSISHTNNQHKSDKYNKDQILLRDALERSTIIRDRMSKEFDQVVTNDLLLATSLQGWMKANMSPSLYNEIGEALKKYKNGIISLYIPPLDTLFNADEHDLQTTRETEMRGTKGKISKVIRPGIKIQENGKRRIVSLAQVEIKT